MVKNKGAASMEIEYLGGPRDGERSVVGPETLFIDIPAFGLKEFAGFSKVHRYDRVPKGIEVSGGRVPFLYKGIV